MQKIVETISSYSQFLNNMLQSSHLKERGYILYGIDQKSNKIGTCRRKNKKG